jgi:predicted ribosomally synthesized peptide with SipW-like signal peptide
MRRLMFVALVLSAGLMVGAAGAYFTAQAQVPDNVIQAGSVSISTEPTSAAISISALAPGTVAVRPLTVVNDGVLPERFVVTAAKKAGITEFYEVLTCRVSSAGTVLYEGTLSALKTTPVTLAPAARAQLDFAIGLPETAGNEVSGDYAKLSLYVDAEQVR